MAKLGFVEARHLVSRTGLGAEWNEINRVSQLSMHQAIAQLLKQNNQRVPAMPRFSSWRKMSSLYNNPARRNMVQRIAKVEGKGLQTWWVKHLLTTKTPFLERMTLFWHNHFPSSIEKTKQANFLYQQNILFRKHALGNYGTLLRAVAKDPAMLLYLDGHLNTKENPNENFAREVLELFTLGRGKYKEFDIKEAARAFTGWTVSAQGKFVNNRADHDNGVKTFLGQRGNFNGDHIINILLKQPRTAEVVAEKMWHEFINISRPNLRIIKQWAQVFRNSNYSTRKLLQTVLTSKEFWDKRNRGALIKSPIDLAIGTLRTLPYKLPRRGIEHRLNILGQGVFKHPSVKGWVGGADWISTQSILLRTALMNDLSGGHFRAKGGVSQGLPDTTGKRMQEWLLATKPLQPIDLKLGKQRLVRALVLDPAYQVN
ncbi:MAG TPA: DUF1800 domain-containing protein [Leucothrix mucor]|nr:DUF1800 domain-containing protein [Leucothrix mucor]